MNSAPVSPAGPGLARILIFAIAIVALVAPTALADDGYLGVKIQDVDETLAAALDLEEADGVLISEVMEDSPAEAAGLQRGDLILTIDGRDASDKERFTRRVRRIDAGESATIELLRKGNPMTISVVLGEVPENEWFGRAPKHMGMHDGSAVWITEGDDDISIHTAPTVDFIGGGGAQLGVNVHSLDEDLGRYFGADEGVLVLGVNEDTAAEEAGFQTGDVILSVEDETVGSTMDLHEVLADFEPGDEVAIRFMRDKQEQTVNVELGEDAGLHFVREMRVPHSGPNTFHIQRAPQGLHYRMRVDDAEDLHEELERLREHLERIEQELQEVEEREG